ncbi:hypothetical protein L1987_32733 [Smallanthus sonchifolius]|uniref:Uncharacterized protein n=1 Tax=Smallanthus sonchifolius TaxID=185202 RepID=A0ACB9HQA7_9ASTR|nr:hypothetical protein L1987_32733 [Smallanthus sonchifolius]
MLSALLASPEPRHHHHHLRSIPPLPPPIQIFTTRHRFLVSEQTPWRSFAESNRILSEFHLITTYRVAMLSSLRTKKLNKFLVDAGLYETKEEAAKREEVLGRLKLVRLISHHC